MYDVVYIDSNGDHTRLASSLEDRRIASELACRLASERGAGRLVLPGSGNVRHCVCVVPQPVATASSR